MSHIATTDGTRLYVKSWGQGRPVILVHGWPLSADSFDEVAVAIADAGMRAISYDRRGFGRSDQPSQGYDYDTLADDLAAVIDKTNARDAALVGFSMGGGEVVRYVKRHRSKQVTQAVLISSVVPLMVRGSDNPLGVDPAVFEAMARAIGDDRAAYWTPFFKVFFGAGLAFRPVSAEVHEWARAMAMQAGLRPTLACIKAFSTTDFRADLAAFNVPTLLIHGTVDRNVPIEISSRLAVQGIRNARLLEYEGAPHGLFISHKDRLLADLLGFLRI